MSETKFQPLSPDTKARIWCRIRWKTIHMPQYFLMPKKCILCCGRSLIIPSTTLSYLKFKFSGFVSIHELLRTDENVGQKVTVRKIHAELSGDWVTLILIHGLNALINADYEGKSKNEGPAEFCQVGFAVDDLCLGRESCRFHETLVGDPWMDFQPPYFFAVFIYRMTNAYVLLHMNFFNFQKKVFYLQLDMKIEVGFRLGSYWMLLNRDKKPTLKKYQFCPAQRQLTPTNLWGGHYTEPSQVLFNNYSALAKRGVLRPLWRVGTYVRPSVRADTFCSLQHSLRTEGKRAGISKGMDWIDDKPSDRILIIDQLLIDQL